MAKYFSTTRDSLGNAVGSATVTVYNAGTTTEAVIYSDYDLQTTKDNPFTADSDGSFEFYTYSGFFKIVVSKTGFTTNTEDNVQILGHLDNASSDMALEVEPGHDLIVAAGRAYNADADWGSPSGGDVLIKSGIAAAPQSGGDVTIDSPSSDVTITAGDDVIIDPDDEIDLRWSTGVTKGLKLQSGPLVQVGTGSPEGAYTAGVGSVFLRTDGGASTTLYIKESGAGNTGWVAK